MDLVAHERKIRLSRFFGPDLDLYRLLTIFFMDSGQGVLARRKIFDRKTSIGGGYGKIRVRHHIQVSLHPRMLIAFQHDVHFRFLKSLENGLIGWHLRFVERRIAGGHGVYVVLCCVFIQHLERLSGHDAQNVWGVTASLLAQYHGPGGWSKSSLWQSVFHVDKDIRQLAVLHHNNVRGSRLGGAARISRHIDWRKSGCRTLEADDAGDGTRCALVNCHWRALGGWRS